MTQDSGSFHEMDSKVGADVQIDTQAANALQYLKQELVNYQAQNKKMTEQLNCLVSLIKRSWCGDQHATVHLSNIVGLDPPHFPERKDNESIARPNSQVHFKSRSQSNWERLAMRLLEREFESVQREIQDYQQKFIENREAYMDAVMHDHQQSMSRIPLSRVTDHFVREVDTKFLRHNQSLQKIGVESRPRVARSLSAGTRRKASLPEVVEQMDVSLRELVGDTPSSSHFSTAHEIIAPITLAPSSKHLHRPRSSYHPRQPPNTYNDPSRYTQGNIYTLVDEDPVRKHTPISASSLMHGITQRSRPRSGHTTQPDHPPVFVTQRAERTLKYETTRPVIGKPPKKSLQRQSSGGLVKRVTAKQKVMVINETNNVMNITNGSAEKTPEIGDKTKVNSDVNDGGPRTIEDEDTAGNKLVTSVQVKSASVLQRPTFIDEFSNDEQGMKDMEQYFKKTALNLQKRLGIGDSGMVIL